jgi:hypothetical protein
VEGYEYRPLSRPQLFLRDLILTEYQSSDGHPDLNCTLLSVSKMFWWPRMRKTATHTTVKLAQRIKALTTKPLGSLLPLPKATRPWEIMSMDFISGLPIVDGFDYIATFVEYFTKQAMFIPYSIHINAPQLARLLLGNIYRHHGLCRTIIFDRDPKLTSTFWQPAPFLLYLCKLSKTFPAHTTHKPMT